jgi:hypothetical protein
MEIQVLLRELGMLNDEVESVWVLEYSVYNDAPQTLLRVLRSSQKDLFVKNVIFLTGWIEKLLSAVLPEELEQDKNDDDMHRRWGILKKLPTPQDVMSIVV